VEILLKGVQQTINAQILTPISTGLNALMSTLEKNPQLIQQCSQETIRNSNGQLNQIDAQIQQIYQMLSQLVYKPSVKVYAGEQILADIWPQYFNKDIVERLGGAGNEDFLVTPYITKV
jgi:hypothetical protein